MKASIASASIRRAAANPSRSASSIRRRRARRLRSRGSEVVKNWVKVQGDVWKVTLPNSFFGSFNPYSDRIHGDWFDPRGREHHTGAVYLNGDWLIEAAKLDEVMMPAGTRSRRGCTRVASSICSMWRGCGPGKGAGNAATDSGDAFCGQERHAECALLGRGRMSSALSSTATGFAIERVDFGRVTEQMEIRAASASDGGIIEIRLDGRTGNCWALARSRTPAAGKSWASASKAKIKPVSGIRTLCLVFKRPMLRLR